MVYRSDLEALKARHDVLAKEVAAHTRELDQVAGLLVEARAQDEADRRMADLAAGGPARRRRKRLAIAAGIVAVAALAGGIAYRLTHPVPDRMQETIVQFEGFADQMCACKTNQCAEGVNKQMSTWAEEMAKDAADKPAPKMSDEQTKYITEVAERFGKCMVSAMTPPQ